MRTFLWVVALIAAQGDFAYAEKITLLAPSGIHAPIQKMIDFKCKTGHKIKATFGSGNGTKKQVMSGVVFDVSIVQPALAEVVATSHADPKTETSTTAVMPASSTMVEVIGVLSRDFSGRPHCSALFQPLAAVALKDPWNASRKIG